uniref:Polyprotein n=1 Tax=Ulva picorna-like virus 1 TaxID=3051529 RepID=A0A9Y2DYB4_9VIRU|nr:MAG: polyprotein [Ulva picorna-like virus 1]
MDTQSKNLVDEEPQQVPINIVCEGIQCTSGNVTAREGVHFEEEIPREIKERTLLLASNLRSKNLVPRGIAGAREEIHCTGTSELKVKKRFRTPKHIPKEVIPKEERKKEILKRKNEAMRKKGPMRHLFDVASYEGFLDGLVSVDVTQATTENFQIMFDKTLSKIHDILNDSKVTIEHVFKLDGDKITKIVTSVAALIIGVFFIWTIGDCGPAVKLVVGGLTALAAVYPHLTDITEQILLRDYPNLANFDFDKELAKQEAEITPEIQAEMDAALARYDAYFAEREPSVDTLFESAWSGIEYQGFLDGAMRPLLCMLTDLGAGAASAITGYIFQKEKKSLVKTVIDNASRKGDLQCILQQILKWIAGCLDAFMGTSFKDLFRQNQELEDWADEVGRVYTSFTEGSLQPCADNARTLQKLEMTGFAIARRFEKMSNSAWAYHRYCMSMVTKMQSVLTVNGAPVTERPVPLTICLRGESGVGKSYVTHALIDSIIMKTASKERQMSYDKDHNSEKHMWLSEETFANGYNGQFAVVFDDFMQFKTQKGQVDDAQKIIRFANAAACRLDAAELERKGRLVFTSPLIVCSTNLYEYWSPSIVKPEALVRRFDLWIEVVPKREWSTPATRELGDKQRRLDRERLAREGIIFEQDTCDFKLMKCVDAVQQKWELSRVLNYAELVEECVTLFKSKAAQHKALMGILSERRRAMLDETIAREKELSISDIEYEGWFDFLNRRKVYHTKDAFWKAFKARFFKAVPSAQASMDFLGEDKFRDMMFSRMEREMRRTGATSMAGFGVTYQPVKTAFSGVLDSTIKGFKKVRETFVSYSRKFIAGAACAFMSEGKLMRTLAIVLLAIIGICVIIWAFSKMFRPKRKYSYQSELLENKPGDMHFSGHTIRRIIDKNVYHMYRETDDPEVHTSFGKVTMVKGSLGMLNNHYIEQMRGKIAEGDKDIERIVLVRHSDSRLRYTVPIDYFLDEDNIAQDGDSDIALVDFKRILPVARDITERFVTNAAIDQNKDFEACLYALRGPRSVQVYDLAHRSLMEPFTIRGNYHSGMFSYTADTASGDCGSLVCYTGDYAAHGERILGMHMGGTYRGGSKAGIATTITQDKLRALIDQCKAGPTLTDDFDVIPESSLLKDRDTCHEVVKKAERAVFQPKKSSIVPSSIQGHFGPIVKRPAALSNEGGIDPLALAHERQHSYNVTCDPDLAEAVKVDVIKSLRPFMRKGGMKLSFEEAVGGHPDLKCLGPIPRQTSAGYSYMFDGRVRNGKKEFFGNDGDYVYDTELASDLKAKVEAIESQIQKGIVPQDRVYVDFLKDECVSLEKASIGKTRMISACDLPMTVVYRRYFGALCSELVRTRVVNGIAVGINPYDKEQWSMLAGFVNSQGGKVVAGDFSGFDNSQTSQLIYTVVEIMSELTGLTSAGDKLAMETLAVTLAQPLHVSGRYIYELDHGMPSGNPMTTIMNSIFGLVAFRLCWLKCTQGMWPTASLSLRAFNNNVNLVMYGDDNILGISEESISYFNQKTMIQAFPAFGLKYTSDVKEDKNPPAFRSITQVSFLKRSFRYEDALGGYVAPLELSTIKSMLDWSKKGASSKSITIDNCDNAVREWSLHGRNVYNEYTAKLKPIAKKCLDHHLEVPRFRYMLMQAVGYTPSWIAMHI